MNKGTILDCHQLSLVLVIVIIVIVSSQIYQALIVDRPTGQELTNLEQLCKGAWNGTLAFSDYGEYCVYQENYSWRVSR